MDKRGDLADNPCLFWLERLMLQCSIQYLWMFSIAPFKCDWATWPHKEKGLNSSHWLQLKELTCISRVRKFHIQSHMSRLRSFNKQPSAFSFNQFQQDQMGIRPPVFFSSNYTLYLMLLATTNKHRYECINTPSSCVRPYFPYRCLTSV